MANRFSRRNRIRDEASISGIDRGRIPCFSVFACGKADNGSWFRKTILKNGLQSLATLMCKHGSTGDSVASNGRSRTSVCAAVPPTSPCRAFLSMEKLPQIRCRDLQIRFLCAQARGPGNLRIVQPSCSNHTACIIVATNTPRVSVATGKSYTRAGCWHTLEPSISGLPAGSSPYLSASKAWLDAPLARAGAQSSRGTGCSAILALFRTAADKQPPLAL